MMRLPLVVCGLLALVFAGVGVPQQQSPNVVETDPLSPADERKQFVVPPGFEVQLVAAEPDIQKPLNIAFDDKGRLWVSDTVEYPYAAKPGQKPRDTVKILSDFAPDGKARSITTFADGLNIPIGVLPLPGDKPRDALVYSIPHIYRLRDSTGKGVADKRDRFYSEFGTRDTHGMTNAFLLNFDGWVYACHGFSNTSNVKGRDAKAIVMQSGNTYRMRPDGSHVEQFTWGQVNPFGLTVDPLGYLYSSDCHSQPIYQMMRGGSYPSFGKPDDGLGFVPETITNYRGSTAIAGIASYSADAFPKKYQGAVFVGDVMTNSIVQFDLKWTGSSPHATQHVLLDSKDKWFRPVDVKVGPDGALYFADFYNRIIGHYEVPLTHPGRDRHRGRIWRLVYTGKGHKGTPAPRQDWTKATDEELASDLTHPNMVVRMTATNELALRGKAGAAAVRKKIAGVADSHALWAIERAAGLETAELDAAMKSPAEAVRVHACRVLAERAKLGDAEHDLVLSRLSDDSPHVRRAAVDALQQHPDARNIRPLVEMRQRIDGGDSHLILATRIALRNQLRPAASWAVVKEANFAEKDARVIADVVPGVHSPESAAFLVAHLATISYPADRQARFVHYAARYAGKEDTDKLVAWLRASHPKSLGDRATLAKAFLKGSQERGGPLSADAGAWVAGLTETLLTSPHGGEVRLGIDLVGQARLESSQAKLVEMLLAPKTPAPLRSAALAALGNLDVNKHAATLGKVLADSALPIELREQAAAFLARANQPATRGQLVAALPTAPARLQNGIAAGLASNREGAELLLDTIAAGKASARLLQERGLVVRLEAAKVPNLAERLKKLTAGLPAADAKLAQLVAARRKGYLAAKADPKRGAEVFAKNCAACHQIAGKGEKIGPNLDGVGLRGLDRLLEDTLDPNANVDQAFRVTSLTTEKGQVIQGLFLREEGTLLVLADNQGKLVRVKKADVADRVTAPLSPMPANVAEQVPEADFYHLMAYLLAQRPMKP
jgi:putative heme-binding domain-containing protein